MNMHYITQFCKSSVGKSDDHDRNSLNGIQIFSEKERERLKNKNFTNVSDEFTSVMSLLLESGCSIKFARFSRAWCMRPPFFLFL